MQSTVLSNTPKKGEACGDVASTSVCLEQTIKDTPVKKPCPKPMGRSGG